MLKSVSISLKNKDRERNSWKKFTVEPQASMIQTLPLPVGGALVVGEETIAYYSQEVQHAIDNPIIKVFIAGLCTLGVPELLTIAVKSLCIYSLLKYLWRDKFRFFRVEENPRK